MGAEAEACIALCCILGVFFTIILPIIQILEERSKQQKRNKQHKIDLPNNIKKFNDTKINNFPLHNHTSDTHIEPFYISKNNVTEDIYSPHISTLL